MTIKNSTRTSIWRLFLYVVYVLYVYKYSHRKETCTAKSNANDSKWAPQCQLSVKRVQELVDGSRFFRFLLYLALKCYFDWFREILMTLWWRTNIAGTCAIFYHHFLTIAAYGFVTVWCHTGPESCSFSFFTITGTPIIPRGPANISWKYTIQNLWSTK